MVVAFIFGSSLRFPRRLLPGEEGHAFFVPVRRQPPLFPPPMKKTRPRMLQFELGSWDPPHSGRTPSTGFRQQRRIPRPHRCRLPHRSERVSGAIDVGRSAELPVGFCCRRQDGGQVNDRILSVHGDLHDRSVPNAPVTRMFIPFLLSRARRSRRTGSRSRYRSSPRTYRPPR